jgi:hypothetical protein
MRNGTKPTAEIVPQVCQAVLYPTVTVFQCDAFTEEEAP